VFLIVGSSSYKCLIILLLAQGITFDQEIPHWLNEEVVRW